jgi:two-component system chemotaxis response regulator CheB
MPEMDGLETLRQLRRTHPTLPVIMFSTLTERGATATLDALAAGASDYVTKPANVGSVTVAVQRVRDELLPRLKGLVRRTPPVAAAPAPVKKAAPVVAALPLRPAGPPAPVRILAIGVSTGGPNALAAVLPSLPATWPTPIVIVQHMPPMFTRLLAERLDAQCRVSVVEAADGMAIKPGVAYVAPGDFHMSVVPGADGMKVALSQGPPENSCRPAADVLFRSVARAYGRGALGLVLTGMGQDGLRGSEAIHEAGGRILAQDEASSVVWGMPGFVVRAGLAERTLPLAAIGPELTRLVAPRPVGPTAFGQETRA